MIRINLTGGSHVLTGQLSVGTSGGNIYLFHDNGYTLVSDVVSIEVV